MFSGSVTCWLTEPGRRDNDALINFAQASEAIHNGCILCDDANPYRSGVIFGFNRDSVGGAVGGFHLNVDVDLVPRDFYIVLNTLRADGPVSVSDASFEPPARVRGLCRH
jgi:hypothetical protein